MSCNDYAYFRGEGISNIYNSPTQLGGGRVYKSAFMGDDNNRISTFTLTFSSSCLTAVTSSMKVRLSTEPGVDVIGVSLVTTPIKAILIPSTSFIMEGGRGVLVSLYTTSAAIYGKLVPLKGVGPVFG